MPSWEGQALKVCLTDPQFPHRVLSARLANIPLTWAQIALREKQPKEICGGVWKLYERGIFKPDAQGVFAVDEEALKGRLAQKAALKAQRQANMQKAIAASAAMREKRRQAALEELQAHAQDPSSIEATPESVDKYFTGSQDTNTMGMPVQYIPTPKKRKETPRQRRLRQMRTILRRDFPVEDRMAILIRLAKEGEREGTVLAAMKLIHEIEGVTALLESPADNAPSSMFSLPGGAAPAVSPVGPVDLAASPDRQEPRE